MFRTRLLACALSFLALTSIASDGWVQTASNYQVDAVAAFVLPASIAHHFMSKRTVTGVRAVAQDMVDDYENNYGIFTVNEIRNAYRIVKATDAELANTLWWENAVGSTFAGIITSLVYLTCKYPSKHSHSDLNCHLHMHSNFLRDNSIAATPFRR